MDEFEKEERTVSDEKHIIFSRGDLLCAVSKKLAGKCKKIRELDHDLEPDMEQDTKELIITCRRILDGIESNVDFIKSHNIQGVLF